MCPRRVYFEKAPYHISIRANNKQFILGREEDKEIFLRSVNKFHERFGFKLHGFVAMDNHAHLVVAANYKITISKIMHAIALSYSVKYRKKYGYTGYVWQGRFRSNIIDGERYIAQCIEYIHNNPVRAGIVEKAADYFWSSYHFYAGGKNPISDIIQIDRFSCFDIIQDIGPVPAKVH